MEPIRTNDLASTKANKQAIILYIHTYTNIHIQFRCTYFKGHTVMIYIGRNVDWSGHLLPLSKHRMETILVPVIGHCISCHHTSHSGHTVKPLSLYKPHLNRQQKCWSLRCSWSIACRCCSNYIFILDLTSGFKRLHKANYKTETRTI